MLVWLAIGAIAAHRLRLSSTAAPPELLKLLQHLAPPTGVALKTSSQITVPVALGLSRPIILLPESFTEIQSAIQNPQSEIAPILAHELAHIRNHDLHWLAVSRALMVLLWSQPLYWLVRRRMRLDQESLADAAAADVSTREQYAEQLVSWARNLGTRPTMRIASAVGLWEGPSQLRQRLALLLDDRFIVLRHFSRKLQFASIALCAITAAALSLITLEPAQSKPQEKPATSAGAPSDNDKTSEPDHITIDDRFILCPVTTELQRSLLGDVDAPKTDASLCVFANYGAYQGDAIESDSAFFAGLSEQLSKLAKRDNRCAIISVQVGQVSQPFDKVHGRAEQLSKLFAKLARDAGFKKGTWSVTYQGTRLTWSEIAANAETAAKLAESGVEDSIGDDQVHVFPVRTFLSRMLMQNADCVVNIHPVWQESDGATLIDGFVPSMKRLIPDLKYARRDLMIVRIRYAKDAEHFVRQWGDNLELRKKFGESFGFANCESQQAQVADEDAKRDREARAAGAKPPTEAAPAKSEPPKPASPDETTPRTTSTTVSPRKTDLVHIPVRVVDEAGESIAGAKVEPLNIGSDSSKLKIQWIQTTDALGKAAIPYPRALIEEYGFAEFSSRVEHPDYIAITPQIPISGKEVTLKLARGGSAEIKAAIGTTAGDVGPIYGFTPDLSPTTRWETVGGNTVRSPQLPAGDRFVGAVAYPKTGDALFSEIETVPITAGQVQTIKLALKPGWQVTGRLADTVPRPIKNGRVMLTLLAPSKKGVGWTDWITVQDDGTFSFNSLPREAEAELQITAVCDGFVSKTPTDGAGGPQVFGPQVFTMHERETHLTLEMIPAAKCVAKVQDTQGKPLAGIKVAMFPSVAVGNGSSSFGQLNGMREMLTSGAYRPTDDQTVFPYQADTDEHGIAELSNIPPFPTYISAANEHYSLPKNPIFALGGAPPVPIVGVYLHSGETTRPTLTLIATKPSETKTR